MKYRLTLLLKIIPTAFLSAQGQGVVLDSSATGTIDWVAEVLKGGVTSIVLLVVAFIGIVFFIERLIVVRGTNFIPKALEKKLRKYTTESDFSGIEAACRSNKSVLAKLGGYISTHTHIPFEILSFGVTDMIGRAVSRQHLRTYPLAVVATISPLLGLLGTIIGMIESFQKVALMGDTGDASVLADSIGKALITTALGLIIAIPSLASYHYFKSKVNSFGIRLEESVDMLMAPWLHPEATKSAEENPSA
ncbi:MotA/TolQ/ExbB proton channel family protein [Coraliomargarita algicola]|uniref:MotA/TolQ/ExbB proton channel family protein n=1 Tax=Coraliomargarita algicola TaxID=3092156 RepID=A0ABZ0RLQ8_9BACT|nr:MotA/TolQ/ExbB proton channel family protein [Coraliomargarita sp. J2-16]WPJ95857.1 MotA/TolQ/ExbB proton channel family protein [Coraliomargarita sp. J2-16]